jgi:hypothetical protein
MKVDVSKLDRSGPEYSPLVRSFKLFRDTVNFTYVSNNTPAGDKAVIDMQAVAEQDYSTVKAIFGLGDVPDRPFVVTVDINAGGAYHMSCADTGIHLIPEDAPSLLVAEHVECFEALSGKWDCGSGPGEGLSRALAITVRPFKVLSGLDGDVAGWWNGGNPQDYWNDGTADDQNEQSNACNTLGLFWLASLGYSWTQISQQNAPNLEAVYQGLTGKSGGFSAFVAALKAIPQPWADNPFPPAPAPAPTPVPVPQPQGNGCNPFGFALKLLDKIAGN